MLQAGFSYLSSSRLARKAVTRFPPARPVVRRFVAGESLDDAVEVARTINAEGLSVSLDYLGESVQSAEEVQAAKNIALEVVRQIATHELRGNISVKPSQLGLDIDWELCLASLRSLLRMARDEGPGTEGIFVRLDMESNEYVEPTISLVEALWDEGHRNVGTVLQTCLRRTPKDVERLNRLGARTRLVKGAYKEPSSVAFPDKADVDRAFEECSQLLLRDGLYPAFATHDERLIERICEYADTAGAPRESFEFQLLYGVRRDLAERLAGQGYPVRIYVPFGDSWYPYLMRRLAERPANVMFMVNSVVAESAIGGLLRRRKGSA